MTHVFVLICHWAAHAPMKQRFDRHPDCDGSYNCPAESGHSKSCQMCCGW